MSGLDQTSFNQDAHTDKFKAGIARNHWHIIFEDHAWPIVVIWISAASRPNAPDGFYFRCDFAGYPQQPPTARLWDQDNNSPLDQSFYPKGAQVSEVFRHDWNNGEAIYAPFDRQALAAHPEWVNSYPQHAWHGQRTLLWYCNTLWTFLNSEDYRGIG